MPESQKSMPPFRRMWVLFSVLIVLPLIILGVTLWYAKSPLFGGFLNLFQQDKVVTAVKIYTPNAGMYEVKKKDLTQTGVDDGLLTSENVSLYYRGAKIPLWVENDGGDFAARFYAQQSDSLYSNENVYWMVFGKDARMPGWINAVNEKVVASGDIPILPLVDESTNSYYASLHEEQDKIYQPVVSEGDHWFWEVFAAPKIVTHEFTLDQVSPGPGVLRLSLWSGTQAAPSPDHHMTLAINGTQVNDLSWEGPGYQYFDVHIPEGVLHDGLNTLSINIPSIEGVIAEIINLNWFEIVYPRVPVATNDQLEFISQGQTLSFTGFKGEVAVFDITDPLSPVRASNMVSTLEEGSVFKGEDGRRYVAVDTTGYKKPEKILPALLEPDLVSRQNAADYVAIGVTEFESTLGPLLDQRKGQGYRTMFVPVEAIYDQFGSGYPEPEAIRQFISYTREDWSLPPKYILLVGDASYDPKGNLAPPEANRIPTFFVQTAYGGQTASDVLFTSKTISDTQGVNTVTLWPDISIGRVPARTRDQVKTFVDKVIEYETRQTITPTTFKILAVADGQEDTFGQEAKSFIDLFPANYQTRLFTPPAGSTDANQEIVDSIDDGYNLVAYFGHGSINMWGKDRLFSTEDIPKLTNTSSYPLIVNMTCLTGLFTHPSIESLTESLLFYPKGGAVQILAPTSLTLPMDQGYLYHGLIQAYLDHPDQSLGQILQQVRMEMLSDNNDHSRMDVILTFLLFGDPSQQIPAPN